MKGSESTPPDILEINRDFGTTYMRRDAYEGVNMEVAALEFTQQFMQISDLKK